jgi:hypothetical protein
MPRTLSFLASLVLAFSTLTAPAFAEGRTLFISSAQENGDGTAWLPVYHGTSAGKEVLYIILDTSSGSLSSSLGVNESQKLANAANTAAVQRVASRDVTHLDFPATVDFSPKRVVVAGPNGFPPAAAAPGAVGNAGYSPLVQLPDGTIVNAPHIANATGQADKALAFVGARVKLLETAGFQGGKPVLYISTDASDPGAAALENSTYAPQLNSAPRAGDDSGDSARASLAAFVNGQTGATNPQRQGLNSALLDGLSPLNVLRWNPGQGRYSPLWDVHPAAWTPAVVAAGGNLRQTDWGTIQGLVDHGQITGPGGAKFSPANFIVDCPIVSQGA